MLKLDLGALQAGMPEPRGYLLNILCGQQRMHCAGMTQDTWGDCSPDSRLHQALRVVLRATHEGALGHCSLAHLKRFAVDLA
jgi:hypothetical protein